LADYWAEPDGGNVALKLVPARDACLVASASAYDADMVANPASFDCLAVATVEADAHAAADVAVVAMANCSPIGGDR
jgi:hypothetical protein